MYEIMKVKILAGKIQNSWDRLCIHYTEHYASDPANIKTGASF